MSRKIVGGGLDLGGQRLTGLPTTAPGAAGDAISKGAADNLYSGIGATQKMLLASSLDVLTAGKYYCLTPVMGFPLDAARTVYGWIVGNAMPVVGGTQTWNLVAVSAAQARTIIDTATVADGTTSFVRNLDGASGRPSAYTFNATDSIVIECVTNTGTTFGGFGPSARVQFANTALSLPSNPATPTSVTATGGLAVVTVAYTVGSTCGSVLIWRDGKPYDIASRTSPYLDTAVVNGVGHTYAASAMNLGGISAKTADTSSVGPSSSFTYYASGVRNLSADSNDWAVTLGSAVGTGITVDGAGKTTYTPGNTGGNNANDRVYAQWKGPDGVSGTLSALRRKELVSASGSASIWEYYFRANAGVTALTSGIQIQVTENFVRVGGKLGGSFLNWTLTGASGVTCAQATAGGTVPTTSSALSATLANNTQYTLQLEVLPVSTVDGSQTIKVYLDTAANYASPALFVTVVLSSATVTAFPVASGIHYDNALGSQGGVGSAAGTVTKQTVVLTPLVAVGS